MGQEILKKQEKNFEKLFGRQIEEDDPLFADVLLMSPETYNENVTTILEEIGVQPQIIYAATKLGFAVVKGWENRYTTQQLKEWREAIQEYDDLKKGKKICEVM